MQNNISLTAPSVPDWEISNHSIIRKEDDFEIIDFDGDGKDDAKSLYNGTVYYMYNKDGSLVSSMVDYDDDSKADDLTIYEYDSDNNLVKTQEIVYIDNKLSSTSEKELNRNQDEIKWINTNYDEYGKISNIYGQEYDDNGNKIRVTDINYSNGELEYSWIYEYDEEGALVRKLQDTNGDNKTDYIVEVTDSGENVKDVRPFFQKIFEYFGNIF